MGSPMLRLSQFHRFLRIKKYSFIPVRYSHTITPLKQNSFYTSFHITSKYSLFQTSRFRCSNNSKNNKTSNKWRFGKIALGTVVFVCGAISIAHIFSKEYDMNQIVSSIKQSTTTKIEKENTVSITTKKKKHVLELDWNEIEWLNNDEMNGSMKLGEILSSKYNYNNIQPWTLAKYYIGCNYNLEKAEKKYVKMKEFAEKHNFDKINASQIKICWDKLAPSMALTLTPVKMKNENENEKTAYFWVNYGNFYPDKFESFDIVALSMLISMDLIYSLNFNSLRSGVSMIADTSNIGWVNFSQELERIFIDVMQESYPIKLNMLLMIDPPMIIDWMIWLMWPFLNAEMKKILKIQKYDQLLDIMDISDIPTICRGELVVGDDLKSLCVEYFENIPAGLKMF